MALEFPQKVQGHKDTSGVTVVKEEISLFVPGCREVFCPLVCFYFRLHKQTVKGQRGRIKEEDESIPEVGGVNVDLVEEAPPVKAGP